MNAFMKTLFGDVRTISVVAIVLVAEAGLVNSGQIAWAPLVIPALVLAGTAWLATR